MKADADFPLFTAAKEKARAIGPFYSFSKDLAGQRLGAAALGDDAAGIVRQLLRLRQQIQRLDHFRIGFRANLQAFFLSESIDKNFAT